MRDQLSKYKWNFLTWPNQKYYTILMRQDTVHKQFTPSTWATTLRNSNTPSNWAWRCTQAPQRPIGRQRHTQAPHGSQGPRHCAQAPLHALGSRRCTQAPHHPLGPQHCPQAPRHPIGPRHHTQTSSTPPHHPAPNLPTLINKFYFDATYDAILISSFVICFLSGLFLLILSSQVYIF